VLRLQAVFSPATLSILLLLVFAGVAEAGLSVDGELLELFQLEPGQSRRGAIVVRNDGEAPQRGRAYLNDYRFGVGGWNSYDPPGSHPRSCAPWMQVSPAEFTVSPGEELLLAYTIQVPPLDSLVGSFWCMVVIEPTSDLISNISAGSNNNSTSVGLQAVVRHAIQYAVNIGETGVKELAIVQKSLERSDQGVVLSLDVENRGERWVRPLIWAEFYDSQGKLVDRQEQQRGTLYPGCSLRQQFTVKEDLGGHEVLVIIEDGDGEAWGAQYELPAP